MPEATRCSRWKCAEVNVTGERQQRSPTERGAGPTGGRRFSRRALLGAGVALGCGACAGAVWFFSRGSPMGPARYTYEVVNTYPHETDAFTQGLAFEDGLLYEGTGIEGRSSLREVELETGKVRRQVDLDARFFGEGITVLD